MNDGNKFNSTSLLFKTIEMSLNQKNGKKGEKYLKSIRSLELDFLNTYHGQKSEGVYYTDRNLSDFMVKESLVLLINQILAQRNDLDGILRNVDEFKKLDSDIKKKVFTALLNIKVCDPACGTGVFLESAANCLYEFLKLANLDLADSKLKNLIVKNLYGFDIDNNAIELCILKLFSWVSFPDNFNYQLFSIIKSNIKHVNSILASFKQKFDVIIGNPPYGNILSKEEKKILKDQGIFYKDIYCSFLLKALDWSSGLICFLVPKSFLLRQGYIHFRHELFSKASIYKIFDLGPNIFKKATNEVQIIIYDKKNDIKHDLEVYDYPKKQIITYKEQEFDILRGCFNNQCSMAFKSKESYVYSLNHQCQYCGQETINLNRIRIKPPLEKFQLLNKIEKIADLNYMNIKDFPKMIRGEEEKGLKEVKKLIRNNLNGNCIFINAKNDFSNYYIKKSKSFNIDEIDPATLKGDNYEFYKGPRLLIKHNNIVPETAFTESTSCFTSSIYSLLHEDINELKYMCAVLNSKLMSFYCTYGINNQKDTTINLNQYMIKHLPIMKPSNKVKNYIVDRVDKITLALEKSNGKHDTLTRKLLNEIDISMNNLYRLNERENIIVLSN